MNQRLVGLNHPRAGPESMSVWQATREAHAERRRRLEAEVELGELVSAEAARRKAEGGLRKEAEAEVSAAVQSLSAQVATIHVPIHVPV